MEHKVNPNKVIDYLVDRVAVLTKEIGMLTAIISDQDEEIAVLKRQETDDD